MLRDVSWHIRSGQRWLLVGANGAGKTQLLKLLAGDVWPTPTAHESRRYDWHGQSFTEPFGVKDEIAYLGAERQDKYARYGWDFTVAAVVGTGIHRTDIPLYPLISADWRRIAILLRQLDIGRLAARRFLTLSYGEQRLALLARALATRPKLLLLDELFEGLDAHKRIVVSRWLDRTARSALPWVLAAHRPEDTHRAATHLARLERGRLLYAGLRKPPKQSKSADAARRRPQAMGRTPASRRRRLLVRLHRANVHLGATPVLQDISFEVRAGECWVVHGPNGSGKTTLLRTIYGDHGVDKHCIERFGIHPGVPLERFKRRVGWIAPTLQADHPQHLTVLEVLRSGCYASIGLNEAATMEDRAAARRVLHRFGLARLAQRTLRELSYGQMRRVLFARAWVSNPQLLLLDEPYAGIDGATRVALMRCVDAAIEQGAGVIITTHHRSDWPRQATHELRLHHGRAVPARAP